MRLHQQLSIIELCLIAYLEFFTGAAPGREVALTTADSRFDVLYVEDCFNPSEEFADSGRNDIDGINYPI